LLGVVWLTCWGRAAGGSSILSATQPNPNQALNHNQQPTPRTLAENSGLQASDVVSSLYAAHAAGDANAGVDIEGGAPHDLSGDDGIMDLYATKWWALKLAADAVVTVLKVDQIIMAKQAGGPKPRGPGEDDD
jgi:T-complex protein 1 subunit theta